MIGYFNFVLKLQLATMINMIINRLSPVYVLIFYFIIDFAHLSGQDYMNKDSLLQVLKNAPEDTSRVYLYIEIGQQYENNIPDSAAYYYLKARDLSQRLNFTTGILKFFSNYTYILNMRGKLDSSLILNLKAVEISKRTNDKRKLATAYGNVGSSYQNLQQYENSINYYLKSSLLFEELGEKRYLAILYLNLCNLYSEVKQNEKAVDYGEKSIAICKERNDIVNLGNAYCNTGVSLVEYKKPRKGLVYLNKALEIAEKTNNNYLKLSVLLSIGDIYLMQNRYEKLKPIVQESYKLSVDLEDHSGEAISLRGYGDYYYHQLEFDKAAEYAAKSLTIAQQFKDLQNQSKALMLLANIAGSRRSLDLQSKYTNRHDSIEKIILNEKITRNIQELETKYETEKKIQQINQLENDKKLQAANIRQKNILNIVLILSLFGLIFTGILIYRNIRQKRIIDSQKISELEKEKQILVSKALIQGQEDERSRLAKDLHDGLGGMLAGVKYSLSDIAGNKVITEDNVLSFQRTIDMLDSSISELRRIAHNMMPEVLIKYGLSSALRDFCTEINKGGVLKIIYQPMGIDEAVLDQTLSITVYRIVQELISNILKHAVASEAIIQLQQIDKKLMVTVEDNGKGFDVLKMNEKKGMGWKNIRSRVEYLNGVVDLQSSPDTGTSVTIEIAL